MYQFFRGCTDWYTRVKNWYMVFVVVKTKKQYKTYKKKMVCEIEIKFRKKEKKSKKFQGVK